MKVRVSITADARLLELYLRKHYYDIKTIRNKVYKFSTADGNWANSEYAANKWNVEKCELFTGNELTHIGKKRLVVVAKQEPAYEMECILK